MKKRDVFKFSRLPGLSESRNFFLFFRILQNFSIFFGGGKIIDTVSESNAPTLGEKGRHRYKRRRHVTEQTMLSDDFFVLCKAISSDSHLFLLKIHFVLRWFKEQSTYPWVYAFCCNENFFMRKMRFCSEL